MKWVCMATVGVFVLVGVLTMRPVFAASISDMSTGDDAYDSAQRAVDAGWLPLFQNNNFLPDRPINRRELAMVLDRIGGQSRIVTQSLTPVQASELVQLSKEFKAYIIRTDSQLTSINAALMQTVTENTVLKMDYAKLMDSYQDEVGRLRAENQVQHSWIIGGGIFLALLGIFIH